MNKTIISIYPRERYETRGLFRPTSAFVLPAAPAGSFTRLVIEDQFQSEYRGSGKSTDERILAEDIANDLVGCWSQPLVNNGGAPGIFVSPIDNPTDEQVLSMSEFTRAVMAQDRYMASKVAEADRLHSNPENRRNINEEHMLAASYLRISGRPWQSGMERGNTKECPFCKTACAHDAVKCVKCGEVIDAEGYAKLKSSIASGVPLPVTTSAKDDLDAIVEAGIQEKPKSLLRPAGAAK